MTTAPEAPVWLGKAEQTGRTQGKSVIKTIF